MASALRPIASISATKSLRSSRRLLVTLKSAPAFASARPTYCPSHRLAPVTHAVCAVRSNRAELAPGVMPSPLQYLFVDRSQSSSNLLPSHVVFQTIQPH